MEKICLLKTGNNQCPYFDKEKRCNAESTRCGFLIKLDENQSSKTVGYERTPRWYEKYLK